jgi:hypothetical protein
VNLRRPGSIVATTAVVEVVVAVVVKPVTTPVPVEQLLAVSMY